MQNNGHTREEGIQKLRELMKEVRICMLTTVEADEHLKSRPMALQQSEFNGDLWFFTGKSTEKTSEIRHHQQVNVAFSDPKNNNWVSISGKAHLIDDDAKKKELWNPIYKAWFPQGIEDPDLTLLKVSVDKAEYWDTPNGVVATLIGLVKAVATGERKPVGEHEKIELER